MNMDPSSESSEDEAEAMAKAIGFSSFGTQVPTKKRKFNPKTDAMVEGQDLASLDRGGNKGQGSGGNKIPLGKPRKFGIAPTRNQNEIEQDVEDEENDQPAYIDTSLSSPLRQDDSNEDEGPAYIDTSLPPPNEEARAAQEKIDAILANSTIPPIPPGSQINIVPEASEIEQGADSFLKAQQDESRSSVPSVQASGTTSRLVLNRHQPRERGWKNDFWYIDYYDPSFNGNPWAELEKVNGLEPKGTWITRGSQAA